VDIETHNDIQVTRVINDFKNLSRFQNTYLDEKIDSIFGEHLGAISPDLVHFQHTLSLSVNLPEISRASHIPTVITLHDFWAICHRVNLVDSQGNLCPGPYQGGLCQECVFGDGKPSLLSNLIVMGKKISSPGLRRHLRKHLNIFDRDVPVVHLDSNNDSFKTRHTFFRESFFSADRLLVPSNFVREQYVLNQFPAHRIKVIPLGIEIPGVHSVQNTRNPGKRIRVGYIGSLIHAKGIDILVRAFRRIPSSQVALEIYGEPDSTSSEFMSQLKAYIDTDSRITFHGAFNPEDKGAVYNCLDLDVIPSRVPETFSFVAREALSTGIPVVASKIGVMPEIIKHGENGYLFEQGNVDQLTEILTGIADLPGVIGSLNCPGPIHITSQGEHINEMIEIYNQLLVSSHMAGESPDG
jgi:glycosyltransferase involved in cell wall biosynthesis